MMLPSENGLNTPENLATRVRKLEKRMEKLEPKPKEMFDSLMGAIGETHDRIDKLEKRMDERFDQIEKILKDLIGE